MFDSFGVKVGINLLFNYWDAIVFSFNHSIILCRDSKCHNKDFRRGINTNITQLSLHHLIPIKIFLNNTILFTLK